MRHHMFSTRRGASRHAAVLLLAASLVAGCSGGTSVDRVSSEAFSTIPPTTVTTTTAAPTTTAPAEPITTVEATTTTEPGPPVYPLTGLLVGDPVVAERPALVVKIDNAPGARPQTGFNSADIVVEEIVNDNLTRFAMVFHSQGSDPVGPIRSGRLQDVDLFSSLGRPLFAWSGGNATVTEAIRSSDLVDIGPNVARAYFRSGDRSVPHNLYSNTSELWTFAPFGVGAPPQQLVYRRAGDDLQGEPNPGVGIALDSVNVEWTWDEATGTYLREMEGSRHRDAATGDQVSAHNVVVLVVEYAAGVSGSPDAQTLGTGEAHVFSAGRYVPATWSRSSIDEPFVITDEDGEVVRLTPGRTFIELPRPSSTLPFAAA